MPSSLIVATNVEKIYRMGEVSLYILKKEYKKVWPDRAVEYFRLN